MNHCGAYGALPSGGYAVIPAGYTAISGDGAARTRIGNKPAKYDLQAWSWGYQILPFMEQQSLWEYSDDNFVAATTTVGYFCPSRRSPTALAGGYWQSTSLPRAQADYAGNGGSTPEHSDSSGVYGDGVDGVIVEVGVVPFVRLKNITDGTSKTILIGEKRMNITYCTTDQQPDDNDGYVGGYQDDVVRFGAATSPFGPIVPEQDIQGAQYTSATLHPGIFEFGSSHPGVVQFVLCDGSVQSIAISIAPSNFQLWASRNDNASVQMATE